MCHTLKPSKQSIHYYSSAKLELLALKWAVTRKFRDYLLGLKFTVYTNNNSLAYMQTSKLVYHKIHWLNKLAPLTSTSNIDQARPTRLLIP